MDHAWQFRLLIIYSDLISVKCLWMVFDSAIFLSLYMFGLKFIAIVFVCRGKGDYQIDYVPAPRITEADKANDRK
jgi:hypothetical protein